MNSQMAGEIPDHRKCYSKVAAAKIINELNIPVDAILPTLLEGPIKPTTKNKRSEVKCQIVKTIYCRILMTQLFYLDNLMLPGS